MNYIYESFSDYLDKGIIALELKDYIKAEKLFLKAIKYALLSTEHLPSRIKLSRIANAEKLIDTVEKLRLQKNFEKKNNKNLEIESSDQQQTVSNYIISEKTSISFNDIIGHDSAKEAIYRKTIYPLKFPQASKVFRKNLGGGILLIGPPGTGKTMLAKATANELNIPFLSVKGSDIMSKFVGEAEKNIRNLFETSRKYSLAIILFDEIDAIAPKRGGSSTVMNRVVPELLSNIQGVEESNSKIILLGATNTPWLIDDALLRPGRFDDKIYIGPPETEDRILMTEKYLDKIPYSDDLELNTIGEKTENFSGADIKYLCDKATDYPYFRWIDTGVEQILTQKDFEEALKIVKPSISSSLLKKYNQYFVN